MIPVGSELQPRSSDDAAVRVCGVEGQRYIVAPAAMFGPPFSLTVDEVAARYVCDDLTLAMSSESELEAWAKLSNEDYRPAVRPPAEPEPSPEDVFRAVAAEDAG
jgi:hypothetical protein